MKRFLVNELLPNASNSDVRRITHICGHLPLALKLLCSSISEDDSIQPSQFLDDFLKSSTGHIIEMLDNPDCPTDHRLPLLIGPSFHRLSAQEKEALVYLCILPESFDINEAAAVLGKTRISCQEGIAFPSEKIFAKFSKFKTWVAHSVQVCT